MGLLLKKETFKNIERKNYFKTLFHGSNSTNVWDPQILVSSFNSIKKLGATISFPEGLVNTPFN